MRQVKVVIDGMEKDAPPSPETTKLILDIINYWKPIYVANKFIALRDVNELNSFIPKVCEMAKKFRLPHASADDPVFNLPYFTEFQFSEMRKQLDYSEINHSNVRGFYERLWYWLHGGSPIQYREDFAKKLLTSVTFEEVIQHADEYKLYCNYKSITS